MNKRTRTTTDGRQRRNGRGYPLDPGGLPRTAGSGYAGAPPESVLIASAMRGDLEAFNQLVLAYQDLVYNQALRLLGDDQAADDATQEAFLSAYRNLGSFRGGSFRAWLARIVTNLCYDEFRRRKATPSAPFEAWDAEGDEIESPTWSMDTAEGPEERVLRAELGRAIQRCLDALSPSHRSVLVLVDVLGYEYAEAAEALGMPVGTVKSRLARARAQLRGALLAAQH